VSILAQHIGFLADASRLEAFRAAIDVTVRRGDIVADVGAGTGILGLMACRAGARRVYAIEQGPIAGLARKLALANGYGDRLQVIRGRSDEIALPEPVDVIVSDLIGEFAFEAGLFETLLDVGPRWLNPDGRLIPRAITLSLAVAELGGLRHHLDLLAQEPAGFDLSAMVMHARNTAYRVYPSPEALLGPPVAIATLSLPTSALPSIHAQVELTAARAGRLDAIIGSFEAELASGVMITNSPLAPRRLDRSVVALPVSPPIEVRPGDRFAVDFRMLVRDHVFRWRVQGRDQESREGSSLTGTLFDLEDLAPHVLPISS
jgi:precorrin-6B methylase 2